MSSWESKTDFEGRDEDEDFLEEDVDVEVWLLFLWALG
jgi:hypothetical protein